MSIQSDHAHIPRTMITLDQPAPAWACVPQQWPSTMDTFSSKKPNKAVFGSFQEDAVNCWKPHKTPSTERCARSLGMNILDYDRLAAEYASHRRVHPGVLRAVCKSVRPEHATLEVGCGTGNYVAALVAITGSQGWGIDPSAEMLAQARRQLDDSPALAIDLRQGQAERFSLDERRFDLVFSVDVIHHVQDRPAYLREAYRALKPGGLLCTATDSEWIIRHREPLATYWPETISVELERYPRVHHLETLYQEAEFTHLERIQVEHRAVLTDIQAYRDKAFSALHLIPEPAFRRGLARLEQDLANSAVSWISRYVLLWGTKG
jgi:ubiquinone/menaquinone biosynthesis C-methylase UbiE